MWKTRLGVAPLLVIGAAACGGSGPTGPSSCGPEILVTDLPDGIQVPEPVTARAEVTAFCDGQVWFVHSGELPPGIVLNQSGPTLTGIPTEPGTYESVPGVRSAGASDTESLSITVHEKTS